PPPTPPLTSPRTTLSFAHSRAPPSLPSFPTRRSSDLVHRATRGGARREVLARRRSLARHRERARIFPTHGGDQFRPGTRRRCLEDRKSTRLNSSHLGISYAVFCLKKKKKKHEK